MEVYKVSFSNGESIVATGNHPIYVENKGFLTIDSLRYSDIIKVSENWEELKCIHLKSKLLNGTVKSGEGIRNQNILAIKDTLNALTSGYTEKYGRTTTEKYQKDTMFITKTTTLGTMILKILKSLKQKNILNTMLESKDLMSNSLKERKSTLKMLKRVLLTGISPKKVSYGIPNTPNVLYSNNLKRLNLKSALTANALSKQLILNLNSAQTTASQHGEESRDLMTNNEHALFVEMNSQSINIGQQKRAQESVQVISVQKLLRKHNVYNISVEEEHEYYANGVLSHNCDSLRYLINELPDDPERLKTKAYAPGTRVKDTESHLPYALQAPKNNTYGKNDWYSKFY
jgi:intein/homing endonuclease